MPHLVTVLALSAPVLADDEPGRLGGGGASWHETWLPRPAALPRSVEAPGWVDCVGGMGLRVEDGTRAGGEGHFCAGAHAVQAYGGPQLGLQATARPFYGTLYGTLGVGWMSADGDLDYASAFLLARGRMAAGLLVRAFAVEAGPYVAMPFPVLQTVRDEPITGPALPHTGFEVTFLWGDFDPR